MEVIENAVFTYFIVVCLEANALQPIVSQHPLVAYETLPSLNITSLISFSKEVRVSRYKE